jgi:hypothetical protein
MKRMCPSKSLVSSSPSHSVHHHPSPVVLQQHALGDGWLQGNRMVMGYDYCKGIECLLIVHVLLKNPLSNPKVRCIEYTC